MSIVVLIYEAFKDGLFLITIIAYIFRSINFCQIKMPH